MRELILFSIFFIFLGIILGKILASKGITIDFQIDSPKSQKYILIILSTIPILVLFLLLLDKLSLLEKTTLLIPEQIMLYLGEYLHDFITVFVFGIWGFLLGLGTWGKKTINTKVTLLISLAFITLLNIFLIYQTVPIVKQLQISKITDNVVFQTTDFTCAPASIATLGRFIEKYPELTEKEVALLTNTDRRGTSTLSEIRALKKLNLNPQYHRGLTLDDLLNSESYAVIHVKEPIANKLIYHAVALLSVDKGRKIFKIANPLYGIQYKSYEEMIPYWYGEAIFIN